MPKNATSAGVRMSRNSAFEAFWSMNFAASGDEKYIPSLVRLISGTAAASNACAVPEAINSTINQPVKALIALIVFSPSSPPSERLVALAVAIAPKVPASSACLPKANCENLELAKDRPQRALLVEDLTSSASQL